MNSEKFRAWFEDVKKGAKTLLVKDKEHAPIVLIIEGSGKLRAILMDFENDYEKHMAYEAFLPAIIQKTEAMGFIAINESWYAMPKEFKGMKEDEIDWSKVGRVSERPDRKEAIMISGFLKGGLKLSAMIPFHRKGKRIIIEEDALHETDHMRFGLYKTAIEAIEKPKADDALVGYR